MGIPIGVAEVGSAALYAAPRARVRWGRPNVLARA